MEEEEEEGGEEEEVATEAGETAKRAIGW